MNVDQKWLETEFRKTLFLAIFDPFLITAHTYLQIREGN